jgi:hypothetical protein
MSGYLSRLASRSTQDSSGLRPRAPAMFEADTTVRLDTDVGLPAAPVPDEPTTPVTPPDPPAVRPDGHRDAQRDRHSPVPTLDQQAESRPTPVGLGPVDPLAPWSAPPVRVAGSPRPLAAPAAVTPPEPHRSVPDVRVAGERPALEPTMGSTPRPDGEPGPALPAPVLTVAPAQANAPRGPVPDAQPPRPLERDGDVVLPRLFPGPPPPEPAAEVTVTIGRVEVIAPPAPPTAAPPPKPARASRPATAPALADYLQDRSRR